MKITIKAILFEINEEHKSQIDKLMTVFSSAIRYSFNRILEGLQILEIEKCTGNKYGLNIRQAKDAVENARQTIVSQKQLLQMNYDNYSKKVNAIEVILKDKAKKLSDVKKKALISKLEKRKRKQNKLRLYIENKTIPPVIFGTKAMFIKRCKGLITHNTWEDLRSNRVYSRGDKTKGGNPNLRIIIKNSMSFLEVSTLEKTQSNRAVKIQTPIYLPQKLSKKTGKINGINYRELFLRHLSTKEAYQVEVIKREGKYYCHITFEMLKPSLIYTGHQGVIGIDTNPDGFGLTVIDNKGNYKAHTYLKQGELIYARSNRRDNLCGELSREVIKLAKGYNYGIAIEDLKFKDDRDVNCKFSRIKHGFVYSNLLTKLESACGREGIEVTKVRPQYTSKIGLYKYCHQYGMDVHNGAAMVIGRRSYGFKEKVPKLLKEKLICVSDINEFNKMKEWSKWSLLDRRIKEKGGENPGLWFQNRKVILELG